MGNVRLLIVLVCGFVFTYVTESKGKYVAAPTFLQAKLERFYNSKDELLDEEDDRIVGGVAASQNEFPFQVSLQMKRQNSATYSHFCGGSIIGSGVILTAAHCCCLPGTATPVAPEKIKVLSGTNDLKSTSGTYTNVTKVSVHEAFQPKTLDNDICTLKLSSKLIFNEGTNLIAINNNPKIPQINTITSGWGVITENGTTTRYLMKATVPTVSDETCKSIYTNLWQPSKVCAGIEGSTSCYGDSGGPLCLKNKLYGCVSGGFGCGHKGLPVIYTNVASFKDWINAHL